MRKFYFAIMTACAVGSGGAQADSLYAGVDGGLANLDADWNLGSCCPPSSGNASDTGALGGIHGGFTHSDGQLMLGVETDLSFTNASEGFDGFEGIGVDLNFLASLRGRLGWNINDITPYITAGVALGDFDYSQQGTFYPGTIDKVHDTQFGVVGGGGVEMAFAEGWTGRAEFLYYDFGKASGQFASSFPYNYDVDSNVTVVRVGLSYDLAHW